MSRRDEIMAYICRYAREHWGPSPSIREVAIEFGLNYTTVYRHIKRLIAEERLEMRDGKLMVVGANWFPPRPKPSHIPPVWLWVYGLRLDDFNRSMADLDERLARLASANGDSEENEE